MSEEKEKIITKKEIKNCYEEKKTDSDSEEEIGEINENENEELDQFEMEELMFDKMNSNKNCKANKI